MNYRHAFHAGNFADVMKHVVLTRVLTHLLRKDTPFRVVDTHAGIGFYDLAGEEAERTQEWRFGVGLLADPFAPEVEALIAPYRQVLAATRARYGAQAYPGSPQIVREMLRREDRAVFIERHPEDAALLTERFNQVANLKVMPIDGWTALHALIPPKERRGLVLIDPPYESRGELDRMVAELVRAMRKWPTGLFLAWYPIKDLAETDRAAAALSAASPRPVLRLELLIDRPDDPARLNGSGLFVVNPPWTLGGEAEILLPALADRLARSRSAGCRCDTLGPERG